METKTAQPKFKKEKKERKERKPRKVTEFRIFCKENRIYQEEIREKTKLSIGCIHSMWNDGKATRSTIKLLYLTFGKKYELEEENIEQMIKTFAEN